MRPLLHIAKPARGVADVTSFWLKLSTNHYLKLDVTAFQATTKLGQQSSHGDSCVLPAT